MTSAPTTVPPMENRPPSSDVPPMTTARIASSSIHRPALLPSAADVLELIIRPAIPAHSAQNTYTMILMRRERMPTRRLASALPPTDSTSRPSAVRRVSATVTATTAATTKMEKGSVSQ